MGAKYGKHRTSGSEKSSSSVFRPNFFSKDKDGSERSLGRSGSNENIAALASKENDRSSPNSDRNSPTPALTSNSSPKLGSGSPQGSPRSQQSTTPLPAPELSSKRGPSFSSKGEKQAALFQKSLSQEGLLNFIRNESVARALQESSGSHPKGEEFAENPFLLRNPSVLQNTWEIHVSNEEKLPTISNIKVNFFLVNPPPSFRSLLPLLSGALQVPAQRAIGTRLSRRLRPSRRRGAARRPAPDQCPGKQDHSAVPRSGSAGLQLRAQKQFNARALARARCRRCRATAWPSSTPPCTPAAPSSPPPAPGSEPRLSGVLRSAAGRPKGRPARRAPGVKDEGGTGACSPSARSGLGRAGTEGVGGPGRGAHRVCARAYRRGVVVVVVVVVAAAAAEKRTCSRCRSTSGRAAADAAWARFGAASPLGGTTPPFPPPLSPPR